MFKKIQKKNSIARLRDEDQDIAEISNPVVQE
jgi:hypothetical protein